MHRCMYVYIYIYTELPQRIAANFFLICDCCRFFNFGKTLVEPTHLSGCFFHPEKNSCNKILTNCWEVDSPYKAAPCFC